MVRKMDLKEGISGIAVTKNCITYPLEASIKSIVPICDEILIADDSNDGTFEILKKMQEKYSKIRIFREKFEVHKFSGDFAGVVKKTNELMKKAQYTHILYLQVDEIWHPNTVDQVRELPKIFKDKFLFKFPFLTVYTIAPKEEKERLKSLLNDPYYTPYGAPYRWAVKMVKNVPFIENIGDAWTFGYKKTYFIKKYVLHPITAIKTLYLGEERLFGDTIYVNLNHPILHLRKNGIPNIDFDIKEVRKLDKKILDEYMPK